MNPFEIIKLIAVSLLLSLVFYAGCSAQKNIDTGKIASVEKSKVELQAKYNKEKQEHSEWVRITRENQLAELEKIDQKNNAQINDIEKERDTAIADLHSAKLKLRQKFTCPSGPSAEAISSADAEAPAGFSTEAQEFLLREAARADEITIQLNNLIDYVNKITKP